MVEMKLGAGSMCMQSLLTSNRLAEHAENCDGNMAEKYKLTLEARCQKLEETLTLWDTGYSSLAELMMGVNKTTPIWGQSTAGDPNGISAARHKMYIALLKDPKFWEADMALRVVQSWVRSILTREKWRKVVRARDVCEAVSRMRYYL